MVVIFRAVLHKANVLTAFPVKYFSVFLRDEYLRLFLFCFLVSFLCSLLQPISSTWYDYWGADYGSYSYNPYTGGVGIPVSKPPAAAATEKPGSQNLSVSVSQGEKCQNKSIK